MVNWQDPHVVFHSARLLIIVIHCAWAIYVWEYFHWMWWVTYHVLPAKKRRFGVGSALYLLCRYFALIGLTLAVRIVNAYGLNDESCLNWLYATRAFAFAAVACTSALLYLRVIALSKENRWVVSIMGLGQLAVWAFVGMAIHKTQVKFFAPLFTCAPQNNKAYAPNMIYPFIYDVACLAIMIFYLTRMQYGGKLWAFLLQQGAVYAAFICAAYLFAVIMVSLSLNDPLADIGLVVILTTASLCATRMQRDLEDFFELPKEPTIINASAFGEGTIVTSKGQQVFASCPTCGGGNQPAFCTPAGCPPVAACGGSCGGRGCGARGCGGGKRCAGVQRSFVDHSSTPPGVHIAVDVAVDDESPNDWKDGNRSFVQDDYEMGKVEPMIQHQWGPRR